MPRIEAVSGGSGVFKGIGKIQNRLWLSPDDPHYDKCHLWLPDPDDPEYIKGYLGKVKEDGRPFDQDDYDAWWASLVRKWIDVPFHSHKIWLPLDGIADDNWVKEQQERVLNYFYQFHQHCWDTGIPFIEDWKKVPFKKGSIRDVFVKGEAKDLSNHQAKIADITNRINEFQIGVSRVPPQDLNIGEKGTIDVGSAAENRDGTARLMYDFLGTMYWYTQIDYNNPANASGEIDTVQIYMQYAEAGNSVRFGTFTDNGSNSFTCHDGEEYGEVSTGLNNCTGLSIAISSGEYIGADAGNSDGDIQVDKDTSGGSGVYQAYSSTQALGQLCDPTDTATFTLYSDDILSLYGTGTESGGGVEVTPGPASLTLTAYPPIIIATDHKTVEPGKVDLTITPNIPSMEVTDHKEVVPGTVPLTLTPNIPIVTVTEHKTVTPGVLAMSLTSLIPTISATGHIEVIPGLVALTLTPNIPVVSVTGHQTVTPGTLALTLTPFIPVVTATDHKEVTPGLIALTITPNIPVITSTGHKIVTPGTIALTITEYVPVVTASDHKTVTPGTKALTLTAYIPTISVGGAQVVTPGVATLTLTPYAPEVVTTDHKTVTPGTLALVLTMYAPDVITATFIMLTAYMSKRDLTARLTDRELEAYISDRELVGRNRRQP